MQHRMIIEIDTGKMSRDNVPVANIQELLKYVSKEFPEYILVENKEVADIQKISLEVNDINVQTFLTDDLEKTDWFMKYVSKWQIYDGAMYNDMIEIERKHGERCSYA